MFDLTRREIRIFAILLILLGLGYGIKQYRSSHPSAQIRVEQFGMPLEPRAAGEAATKIAININTAGASELMKLKGVGSVIAGRIVEYRAAHGPFFFVEDIKKVQGVSEKLFQQIKDDITTD